METLIQAAQQGNLATSEYKEKQAPQIDEATLEWDVIGADYEATQIPADLRRSAIVGKANVLLTQYKSADLFDPKITLDNTKIYIDDIAIYVNIYLPRWQNLNYLGNWKFWLENPETK